MKFSFNSLNNFIELEDFSNKLNELSEKLSFSGFEVEEWTRKSLPDLVVVEVKKKKAHPSADRLSLCQVQSKGDKVHFVVCGATNFKEGDKVVLALPGAILPGPIKIKKRKIRGEMSEGMLVSSEELGLAASPDFKTPEKGIIVLSKEVETGTDFAAYAGLNDVIFDIDITPNRADCLSHFGMARELSCILNRKLKEEGGDDSGMGALPASNGASSSVSSTSGPSLQKCLDLEVKQPKLCTRYTGRAVYGVQVKPSPFWLKVCLESLGFKSINNIVDITNYLLIQWGQPLHAFDLDYLHEKIVVDMSQKKESFQTLDNQNVTLTGEELCIRDGKRPLALAGVIGGVSSGIHSNTKNVFVESACFEPSQVRMTSKKFNIETDSSYLFSRGVPSENTLYILHKAVTLIQELAGGKISVDEYDFWKKQKRAQPIEIQKKDLERRLGMEVSITKFQHWMEKLGCKVQSLKKTVSSSQAHKKDSPDSLSSSNTSSFVEPSLNKNETIKVFSPFFRFDLNIKEDLIEEYARLEGYDKIPEKISYLSGLPKPDQKEHILFSRVARILVHEGFYQAINHSFISQKFSDSFLGLENIPHSDENSRSGEKNKVNYFLWSALGMKGEKISPVFIQNPLSAEYNMMRVGLAPSLFKNAQQSIRHGCLQGRLFEVGRIFACLENNEDIPPSLDRPESLNKKASKTYREGACLAFIAWGQEEGLWEKSKRLCVYDLKTALQTLLECFYIFNYEWVMSENKSPCFIHPGQYMELKIQEKTVAYIGSLSPVYAEKYKIRTDMALAEMNIQFLIEQDITNRKAIRHLSPFPRVERDLSVLVSKDFPAGSLIREIKQMAGPVCKNVQIFDIYENEDLIKKDMRSVSFRLTLQSDEKTLTEDSLKKLQDKLTKKLMSQYSIRLRSDT